MNSVFDLIASSYIQEDAHWGSDLDVIRESIQRLRNSESRVRYIDLGCGPGFHIASIAEFFPDILITGIDASEAMLNAALQRIRQSNLKGIVLRRANILSMGQQEMFDVVSILNNTLGNLAAVGQHPWEVRQQATRRIRSMMRLGGELIISVYNRKGRSDYGGNFETLPESNPREGEFLVEYQKHGQRARYYSHWFSEKELVHLLWENGFRIHLIEHRMSRLIAQAWAI